MLTTSAKPTTATEAEVPSASFQSFAGVCTILAGSVNFLYAVAFGFMITTTVTALYFRLRQVEAAFALWALLLGLVGTLGAAIHGGYDLANAINRPAVSNELTTALAALPSQTDPRGLTTFGLMGVALLVFAWLMARSKGFPKSLPYVGYLLGILFLFLYLGRLILLDPANPVLLVPILAAGFVVNPVWYIWLGLALSRRRT